MLLKQKLEILKKIFQSIITSLIHLSTVALEHSVLRKQLK